MSSPKLKTPGLPVPLPTFDANPLRLGELLIGRLYVLRIIKYNREHSQLIYFDADYSFEERVRKAQEWCNDNSCRFMFLEPRPAIAIV